MHTCSKETCTVKIGGAEQPTAYVTDGKWTCPKHTPTWIIQWSEGNSTGWCRTCGEERVSLRYDCDSCRQANEQKKQKARNKKHTLAKEEQSMV